MIKEDKKENEIYDFYDFDPWYSPTLGVVYITDKQYAFDKRIGNVRVRHNDIIDSLDAKIHPNENPKDREIAARDNNAYIYLYGNYYMNISIFNMYINLPANNEFSLSQYMFLCNMLDKVHAYIKEKNKKVEIIVSSLNEKFRDIIDDKDIQSIKDNLLKRVTKSIHFEEEVVVGKTLPEEIRTKAMLFHINLDGHKSISDLTKSMDMCDMYHKDSFYHDLFCKVFPNYLEVRNLIDKIIDLGYKDLEINDLTIDNIYDKLNEIYLETNKKGVKK